MDPPVRRRLRHLMGHLAASRRAPPEPATSGVGKGGVAARTQQHPVEILRAARQRRHPFSRAFSLLGCQPTAPYGLSLDEVISARAHRMLLGDCIPMLCPIHVPRPGPAQGESCPLQRPPSSISTAVTRCSWRMSSGRRSRRTGSSTSGTMGSQSPSSRPW